MRCSYNYWQFSENECAPFSKYIYEQKFEASILFFSLSLLLVSLLRSFLCAACAIFPSFSSSNFPWCGENWFNGTISPSAGNVAFYDATRRATRSRSTFASLSAHLDLHRRSLGQESSTTWKLTFFNRRLSFFRESETLQFFFSSFNNWIFSFIENWNCIYEIKITILRPFYRNIAWIVQFVRSSISSFDDTDVEKVTRIYEIILLFLLFVSSSKEF